MDEKKIDFLAPIYNTPHIPHRSRPGQHRARKPMIYDFSVQFIRKHGILLAVLALLAVWTLITCSITAHRTKVKTEARLSVQYAEEYEAKIQAFYDEQDAVRAAEQEALLSVQAQMEREADALARLIGPMKTKRMKQTMIWNVLARVDNAAYPDSVEAVIEQPRQWMFYDESNPIREDDRALALEQLAIWHDGRYPAGLSVDFVYGEWSDNDYVLRDSWDRNSRTNYWRAPE